MIFWTMDTVDCSAVTGSGVTATLRYLASDRHKPVLLRWKPGSAFWETLSCPASLNTGARTARPCGRETAAFHISPCPPLSEAVFHTPGRGWGVVGRPSRCVTCHSWTTRANCASWSLICGHKCLNEINCDDDDASFRGISQVLFKIIC